MPSLPSLRRRASPGLLIVLLGLGLSACAVGPDFVAPTPDAPDDWTSWRSGDAALVPGVDASLASAEWWRAFDDPVLDELQRRAAAASPDLQTAALHFAQARVQRSTVAAQRGVHAALSGSATRQRQSERGAGTRLFDVIGADRDTLAELLSEPFNLYQAGFDASWELDLWGRVRRSIEAADAGVARQAALLDLARLSIASDVAHSYFQLRTAQRQIELAREEVETLEERTRLLQARVEGGIDDHLALDLQQAELAAARARLPALQLERTLRANQLALLLGEHPGALREELEPVSSEPADTLPDLSLGLPSEVALRRPDIRAAEAELHRVTANIGIAQAELYPSIRLGGRFGYESYLSGEFSDWGSRTWSIGPVLDLPLFDHGRRKSVVELRKLEQQEAAIAYRKTVMRAWQEIDDALSAYNAAYRQREPLQARERAALDASTIAQARYDAGLVDFLAVLDSRRTYLQTRRERADNHGQLRSRFIAVNKALGNGVAGPYPRAGSDDDGH